VSADNIAMALGGRTVGASWIASAQPTTIATPVSLSLRDADDGKVLVHCHAGCRQEHVIAALCSRGMWAVGR
jgi:hypothetical protein